MNSTFSLSSLKKGLVIILLVGSTAFCSDKNSHSGSKTNSPQDCPGGVCSARGVVDSLTKDKMFGSDPLAITKEKPLVPPAAREDLEMGFSLTPAAPIDRNRFKGHKEKIEVQEKILKEKLGKEDKENTVLVIGAEQGKHCPRCDAAAKALRDKGYNVVKVPYSQVPHVGSAAWLQTGKKGDPQFPFLAFWGGEDFVYRTYQP